MASVIVLAETQIARQCAGRTAPKRSRRECGVAAVDEMQRFQRGLIELRDGHDDRLQVGFQEGAPGYGASIGVPSATHMTVRQ
ncbi:MAG: hypothetical protein ACM3SX_21810 [Deltaproteobacteria bacterium]